MELCDCTRALRYYRIGIKNSILLLKSIVSVLYRYRHSRFQKVSVQYQYQNFLKRKYHISISIEFYTLWYHAQYQLLKRSKLHFSSKQKQVKKGYFGLNWVVFCYIYGITLGIKHFMLGISIVSVSKLQTIKVSVSYRYRSSRSWKVSVQYQYRIFGPWKYQYRIGIEKNGIEGLCLVVRLTADKR